MNRARPMAARLMSLRRFILTKADLHVVVNWLQLPEFLSFFLYYLNFEFLVGFKEQFPWLI